MPEFNTWKFLTEIREHTILKWFNVSSAHEQDGKINETFRFSLIAIIRVYLKWVSDEEMGTSMLPEGTWQRL